MSKTNTGPREGLTWAKISRSLALLFQPSRLTTYLAFNRFEEIPLSKLLQDGMQGILIDADGTMGPHHTREFNTSILEHVQKMLQKGLKVAIYTNAFEDRFQSFEKLGVKIVSDVPPKPDREGFEIAMKEFLQLQDPSKICMVGDNYITDGGAIDAGMHFIYIQPVKGNEPFVHALTRYLAYLCARIYGKIP
ncbi:MAG: HAD-IA family hydrolase [Nitrospinae bacterium]|nr:HAD-IA family hydrolase [Nitrospinota bacterium]MZH05600.1 HAD-IA family hydrolase [Nitrospinota bacterium]MZH15131.1 HAD-IA family hydrolase [Nitrospinota bacterium]